MTRLRVLYLAHRIPFPPDKGDKIRSWSTLEHLARRFDVFLAAFVDDPADFRHQQFLQSICQEVALVPLDKTAAVARSLLALLGGEPFSFAYYRDRRMTEAVRRARSKGLAAEIAFSSSVAPYLSIRGCAPRIVDLCDADSAKWEEYARRKSWPMSALYAREGRLLARAETAIVNWADAAFAVSEEEADLLASREGVEKEVLWFGNGVDAERFAPGATTPAPAAFSALFVGAMDYWANIDAVLWFAAEIWPKVKLASPEATFGVVGSNPSRAVRALDGQAGVCVTGAVEDVRPYLQAAQIVVAPIRIARGVQNKVLEAMAMAKALVATPAALEGVNVDIGKEAVAAASPEAFAAEAVRLLSDPETARAIGAAGRARMLADYQWPSQLVRLDDVLDRLTGPLPSGEPDASD